MLQAEVLETWGYANFKSEPQMFILIKLRNTELLSPK